MLLYTATAFAAAALEHSLVLGASMEVSFCRKGLLMGRYVANRDLDSQNAWLSFEFAVKPEPSGSLILFPLKPCKGTHFTRGADLPSDL